MGDGCDGCMWVHVGGTRGSSSFVSSNCIIPFVYTSSDILLNFRRSSQVQGCVSNGHYTICLMDLGVCPHLHVMSPLKYFHLLCFSLLHVTPVRNLLRHLHTVQGQVIQFARHSSRLIEQVCDVK